MVIVILSENSSEVTSVMFAKWKGLQKYAIEILVA